MATICPLGHHGDLPLRLFFDPLPLFFGWLHLNILVYFGLHFLCYWAIRVLRLVEGKALEICGNLQRTFYSTL